MEVTARGAAMTESLRIPVTESSQVAAARRAVAGLALRAGLDATDQGRAAIVVTEAATNLVKHAAGGEILARTLWPAPGVAAVEVIALDRGPGLAKPADAFVDGFSTSGSPGTGLGAIRRMSDAFGYHSTAKGLVLVCRIDAGRAGVDPPLDFGVVCVRKPGETVSGDAWRLEAIADGWIIAVVDGLGHGPLAARAAGAGLDALDPSQPDPVRQIQRMHDAMRPTRGAAVGIATISGGQVRFCGVGNIVCRVLHAGRERQLVTHNGIVGHEMRKADAFAADIGPQGLAVLHSDGLTSQWSVSGNPGLEQKSASVIAAVLFRDHVRGRDDATIVVAKLPAGERR